MYRTDQCMNEFAPCFKKTLLNCFMRKMLNRLKVFDDNSEDNELKLAKQNALNFKEIKLHFAFSANNELPFGELYRRFLV